MPAGYQKLKNGIFPISWCKVKMHTLFQKIGRKNIENNQNVLTISAQKGLIQQNEFFNRSVASEDKSNYFLLKKGEFAYNKSYSNGYPYGTIKRMEYYDKGIVSPLYICFAATKKNENPNYLLQYFEAGKLNREISSFAQEGARNHGLLNIAVNDFFNMTLIAPPQPEQKRIAAILETQDRVIALREKLLAEKLRQKQYLMQVLLTGKKRLCGSTRIWQYQALKDISREITKKAGNEKYEVLSISAGIGFVNQAKKFGKLIAGKQYKNYIVISHGDFSYNKGNSKKYPQGCVYPLENQDEAAVPNVFISFRLDKNICFWKFYKYVFENGWLNKQLRRLISSGARGDGLLNLSDEDFYSCIVPVPPLNEQVKIADILSGADQEIDLLRQALEQERQKKKALMQLLLSGIVRVL